jgi:predicted nucleic acid-binding protein
VLPDLVLDELHRVLTEKLAFAEERSHAACELLARLAIDRPAPRGRADAITGDPADDAILACALEAGVDVLATGDRKHLLPMGEHRGVRLLTPQALLAELRSQR